jgi:hypothetical protein
MASRLAVLLRGIEPVPDQVDRCVDQAFNTFPMPGPVITQWDDFVRCMAQFYCHVESGILGIKGGRACNLPMDSSMCFQRLKKKYGGSAPQATFEMARTGNEGGLLRVLKTVAELLAREHSDNRIGLAVSCYWNGRPPQELLDDGAEYIRDYGHLLPSEITEGSAGRIYANFPKVLKEHPYLMRRMRRVGR